MLQLAESRRLQISFPVKRVVGGGAESSLLTAYLGGVTCRCCKGRRFKENM